MLLEEVGAEAGVAEGFGASRAPHLTAMRGMRGARASRASSSVALPSIFLISSSFGRNRSTLSRSGLRTPAQLPERW